MHTTLLYDCNDTYLILAFLMHDAPYDTHTFIYRRSFVQAGPATTNYRHSLLLPDHTDLIPNLDAPFTNFAYSRHRHTLLFRHFWFWILIPNCIASVVLALFFITLIIFFGKDFNLSLCVFGADGQAGRQHTCMAGCCFLYFLLGGNHKGTFLYTAFGFFWVLRICIGTASYLAFCLIWLLCLFFSGEQKGRKIPGVYSGGIG
ncbi:hypothetical protein QBC41DRAFT_74784 [Cercophora samala]|uniref:Uncharacterized protein n=1 Tax=Cercophora samala TaxID=330535 RepID=A0AA39ZH33_9PEZI|nr:hypothetical protein QBC41DRAFT_74784 [Cercophora samala]